MQKFGDNFFIDIGRRFAAALLPRLFGTNPRSHNPDASVAFLISLSLTLTRTRQARFGLLSPARGRAGELSDEPSLDGKAGTVNVANECLPLLGHSAASE